MPTIEIKIYGQRDFIEIPSYKYSPSCYKHAGARFTEFWEALCNNSPTDKPFKVRACLPRDVNKDVLGAFIHLASIENPHECGNWIERQGRTQVYIWKGKGI